MNAHKEGLSKGDFDRLRALVYSESGINLSVDKKMMMEIRLKRRVSHLSMSTLDEYCDYVFTSRGKEDELIHLIDAITTTKTDFFREPGHFDFLTSKALPEIAARAGTARRALIWSAGCSTGEEPYTLAMVLSEQSIHYPGFRFRVLASDICTKVLEKASLGIYKSELIRPVSQNLQRKYFMRSRDPDSQLVRVVPELRSLVEFRRINFADADFGLADTAEVIFCRNVIIYFDRQTQLRILEKLTRQLVPGGYFFSGHSESLQGMDLPLVAVAPAVYRKQT